MVRSLIEFLVEHKRGARFTIAAGSDEWQPRERSKAAVDGWTVPKTLQQCDRIISVAPLATGELTGVSLSVANYWGIAPGARYGFPKTGLLKLGHPDEVVADLFSYHPADDAIVGGTFP